MRSGREQEIDHLYRGAGFGASQEEVEAYTSSSFASYSASVARLLNYSEIPDDVDSFIGRPGYVGVTARSGSGFQPANNILDARQRWLFRMVHTKRPLQEKMALFWHNHFATAYSKVANDIGDGGFATRMLAATGDEEARRTLLGIRSGLPSGVTDILALDIDGGSTEFILDQPGHEPIMLSTHRLSDA